MLADASEASLVRSERLPQLVYEDVARLWRQLVDLERQAAFRQLALFGAGRGGRVDSVSLLV